MSLSGKVIALSGAASGIGLATARLLATKGAKLSLADSQEQALQSLATELRAASHEVLTFVVDVRNRASVEDWTQQTVACFGKLDGAVNSAGVGGKNLLLHGIHEIEDEDWDWVFDVNVKGALNCLRAQIPHFKDGGSIVNVASLGGLMAVAKNSAYVASKHALVGLCRTAAKELGARNIRVNCVCPGPIETPLLKEGNNAVELEMYAKFAPMQRIGQPEEVATVIEWLLSSNSCYVTGTSQVIDGGVYAQ
ncbi:Uncharacterized protein BP5553_09223 [Venustampulla echinocandica]|uniref:Ketoreductase domain-containing protein n=1 Tax=Venustampulla echinocandica TaxID=2656787 RepID=A0A370TC48_9HELO|nr:Uncharacterized protein BP5553_09223 [Venustampulla echinocandica]RDL31821.1 Uncharacterized protein BP5553_09223 [Venustampulla echinocandica]